MTINGKDWYGTVHLPRTDENAEVWDVIVNHYKEIIDRSQVVAFEDIDEDIVEERKDLMDAILINYAHDKGKTVIQLDTPRAMEALNLIKEEIISLNALDLMHSINRYSIRWFSRYLAKLNPYAFIEKPNFDTRAIEHDAFALYDLSKLLADYAKHHKLKNSMRVQKLLRAIPDEALKRDEKWVIPDNVDAIFVGSNHVMKYAK